MMNVKIKWKSSKTGQIVEEVVKAVKPSEELFAGTTPIAKNVGDLMTSVGVDLLFFEDDFGLFVLERDELLEIEEVP